MTNRPSVHVAVRGDLHFNEAVKGGRRSLRTTSQREREILALVRDLATREEPEQAHAFVEILAGSEALVPGSDVREERKENADDVLRKSDMTHIRLLFIEDEGKLRRSRTTALPEMAT